MSSLSEILRQLPATIQYLPTLSLRRGARTGSPGGAFQLEAVLVPASHLLRVAEGAEARFEGWQACMNEKGRTRPVFDYGTCGLVVRAAFSVLRDLSADIADVLMYARPVITRES